MRRALIAVLAVVLTAARAQEAFGQCTISSFEINGVITLCADGGDAWQWTGPGGFTSGSMCIEPSASGTYSLRTFDATSGSWSDPCTHLIGNPGNAPACDIVGADSVCAGTSVEWCGPAGEVTYMWTGPGGFLAAGPCVAVSTPGTYTLITTDRLSGASSDPCTKTLYAKYCSTPEPPQPPPGNPMCPAPPRWWSLNCDPHRAVMSSTAFAQVAQLVDSHSAVWSFSGQASGLCELLAPQRHGRPFNAARRQFAALHANLAAAELGATDMSSRPIGLYSDMMLDGIPGVAAGTTLGQWVAATEAQLLAMGDGTSRSRVVQDECRRIQRQAHEINKGWRREGCATTQAALLGDDDEEFGAVLSGGASALISSGGSGPFSGGNRMRWSLERAGEIQLDVVDLSGRRVRHLVNGTYAAGTHEFSWDGRDDSGRSLEPGAYFVAGFVAQSRVAQRLILVK